MIPEATLRQIAEHSVSAESRALAKQLLEAMSLPGYERLAKERDAATKRADGLAEELATANGSLDSLRKAINEAEKSSCQSAIAAAEQGGA